MRRQQRRRLIATKRQKAQATTKTRGKTRTQVATVTTKKSLPVNDEYKEGKNGLRQSGANGGTKRQKQTQINKGKPSRNGQNVKELYKNCLKKAEAKPLEVDIESKNPKTDVYVAILW